MMKIPDFRSAELLYTIANTPTFLARKIREDEEVQKFSTNYSSEDILAALNSITKQPPADLRGKYLPLVLIGALSAKGDRRALRMASEFDRGIIRWFHEVLDYLIQVTPADNRRALEIEPFRDVSVTSVSKNSSHTVKTWN